MKCRKCKRNEIKEISGTNVIECNYCGYIQRKSKRNTMTNKPSNTTQGGFTMTTQTARKEVLKGHISPDTAYIVKDYPYGFRLRTSIRYWVETKGKSGCGERFCSQTLNPKTGQWNKPKYSTYAVIIGMHLDNIGHVSYETLSSEGWSKEEDLKAFEAFYAPLSEYQVKAIRYIRASNVANSIVKWEIKPEGTDTKHQTQEEQQAIWNKALGYGYSQVK